MKKISILIILISFFILESCHKPGEIQVQNNISAVKITDIYWGDNYLSNELLPGESSSIISISNYDEELPATFKVRFKMTANNKSIYLETVDQFSLNEEEFLLITLNDNTKVANPN